MQTVRAFIAIELSNEVRAALVELQNRLKTIVPRHSVRWSTPESMHLTLHFLGDVAVNEVSKVVDATRMVASTYPAFALTFGGLGCFPNTRRPYVIWAGLWGEFERLFRLHQNLGEPLKMLGFTLDSRPYSPHLTLGRVKDGLPQRQLTQLGQVIEQTQGQVGQLAALRVDKISLMRSDLKSAGAIYTQLASAALHPSPYPPPRED